jgi:hypothetical protein
LPDYGLDEFQKDFVAHGFYGYVICSFVRSKMMEDPKNRFELAIIFKKKIYEVGSINFGYAGE